MKPAGKGKSKAGGIANASTDASPRPSIVSSVASSFGSKKKNKIVKKAKENFLTVPTEDGEEPQDQSVSTPATPGKRKIPLKKKVPTSAKASVQSITTLGSVISIAGGPPRSIKKKVGSITPSMTSIPTGPPIRGSTTGVVKGKAKRPEQGGLGKKIGVLGAAKAKLAKGSKKVLGKVFGKGKKKGQGGGDRERWYGKEDRSLAIGIVGAILLLVLLVIVVGIVLSGGNAENNGTTASLTTSTKTSPSTSSTTTKPTTTSTAKSSTTASTTTTPTTTSTTTTPTTTITTTTPTTTSTTTTPTTTSTTTTPTTTSTTTTPTTTSTTTTPTTTSTTTTPTTTSTTTKPTTTTTPKPTTTSRCLNPNPPDPSDPIEIGYYCRDCDNGPGCNFCCLTYLPIRPPPGDLRKCKDACFEVP